MLEFAETGEGLDLSLGTVPVHDYAPVDREAMQSWGPDRTIRAELLRHLLVTSQWPVHAKGVRLQGARITGTLDLESATLRCPLVLHDCYLEQQVVLVGATVSLLELSHCWLDGLAGAQLVVTKRLDLSRSEFTGAVELPDANIAGHLTCRGTQITGNDMHGAALAADRVTVDGTVFLDYGFRAAGAVQLSGARITSQLSFSDAQITGSDVQGNALAAAEITVGGTMLLDAGFTAAGTVLLTGARIAGQLSCSGAEISGNHGNALLAAESRIGGTVFLDEGFTADGAVRLSGARIKGQLSCSGATITRPRGSALAAVGVTVGGIVFLDRGFSADGDVQLTGTHIIGQLKCSGAQITATDDEGNALVADRLIVEGDVFLDDGFATAGAVRLTGAQIDGGLSLHDATLAGPVAFVAEGARISQQFVWAPATAVTGLVNLERTQVHRLDDDWGDHDRPKDGAYWPSEGRLRLAGFVYDGFGGDHSATCQQRLDWIRSQHRKPVPGRVGTPGQPGSFDTQPYEQLARVYRQAGQDTEARRIAIAQRSDLRTYGSLGWWRRAENWLLDVTIKHGYQPLRAVGMLLALYAIALGLSWGAQQQAGLIVSAKDTGLLRPAPTSRVCTKDYPCFYPVGYAIDVTIPIIKTGQAEYWRPNGAAPWGRALVAGTWVFTGLGWAFTTLAVGGYTGLIRQD